MFEGAVMVQEHVPVCCWIDRAWLAQDEVSKEHHHRV
jgi:hypothetical protein